MSAKIYKNGAWQDVEFCREYNNVDKAWNDKEIIKKYNSTSQAWEDVWDSFNQFANMEYAFTGYSYGYGINKRSGISIGEKVSTHIIEHSSDGKYIFKGSLTGLICYKWNGSAYEEYISSTDIWDLIVTYTGISKSEFYFTNESSPSSGKYAYVRGRIAMSGDSSSAQTYGCRVFAVKADGSEIMMPIFNKTYGISLCFISTKNSEFSISKFVQMNSSGVLTETDTLATTTDNYTSSTTLHTNGGQYGQSFAISQDFKTLAIMTSVYISSSSTRRIIRGIYQKSGSTWKRLVNLNAQSSSMYVYTPYSVAITPDGKMAFLPAVSTSYISDVSSYPKGLMYSIEKGKAERISYIPYRDGSFPMALSLDSKRLYAYGSGSNYLDTYDCNKSGGSATTLCYSLINNSSYVPKITDYSNSLLVLTDINDSGDTALFYLSRYNSTNDNYTHHYLLSKPTKNNGGISSITSGTYYLDTFSKGYGLKFIDPTK